MHGSYSTNILLLKIEGFRLTTQIFNEQNVSSQKEIDVHTIFDICFNSAGISALIFLLSHELLETCCANRLSAAVIAKVRCH